MFDLGVFKGNCFTNGVSDSINDISRYEITYSIMMTLIELGSGGAILEKLRDIAEKKDKDSLSNVIGKTGSAGKLGGNQHNRNNGNGQWINTFPMGVPTKKVFREYFGIVCGSNSLFRRTLENAIVHCQRYRKCDNPPKDPSIVIITDRWIPEVFSKYELQFIKYAIENGFSIHFYLVTDYGISEIPFINSKSAGNLRNSLNGQVAQEIKLPIWMEMDEVDFLPMYFEYIGIANASGRPVHYYFYRSDHRWRVRRENDEIINSNNIIDRSVDKRIIRSFCKDIMQVNDIINAYTDYQNHFMNGKDRPVISDPKSVCGELRIFDRVFYITNKPGNDNERILKKAIDRLLKKVSD